MLLRNEGVSTFISATIINEGNVHQKKRFSLITFHNINVKEKSLS